MKDQLWYVVYTKSRSEKKVSQAFDSQNIAHYLPLQKTLKQWSDRKKWVEEPLFKSYIFLNIDYRTQYLKAIQTDGVVKFIEFCGKPVVVKNQEIENIKRIIEHREFEIILQNEIQNVGDKVEVMEGSLKGMSGTLTRFKGKEKVLIKIDSIDKNIILDININYLKKTLK